MQACRLLVALAFCGAALAPATAVHAQQSASFAVAVTLHTAMAKPDDVARMCDRELPSVELAGAVIEVACPTQAALRTEPLPAGGRPEVLVTF